MQREGVYSSPFTLVHNETSRKMNNFGYKSISHRNIFYDNVNNGYRVAERDGWCGPADVWFGNRVETSSSLVVVGTRIMISWDWSYLLVRIYDEVANARASGDDQILGRSSVKADFTNNYSGEAARLFGSLDDLEKQLFMGRML